MIHYFFFFFGANVFLEEKKTNNTPPPTRWVGELIQLRGTLGQGSDTRSDVTNNGNFRLVSTC